MQRFGRILRLIEGKEAEYEKHHTAVWPDVLEATRNSGIVNYSIFRHGRWLFSYFELPDGKELKEVSRVCGENGVCRRWEELMHILQEPLPESSGNDWWVPMKEIWHLPE